MTRRQLRNQIEHNLRQVQIVECEKIVDEIVWTLLDHINPGGSIEDSHDCLMDILKTLGQYDLNPVAMIEDV